MKRKIILICVAVLCLALAWRGISAWLSPEEAAAPPPSSVLVQAQTLTSTDVPVFLSGIGNVIAMNSVLVRSRIDGDLMALHFEEGQFVEKWTLLAEIDARAI